MSVKQRLMSQSTIIFAARIGGAGLMFLTQALVARAWGPLALGDYLVAIAVANLLAVALPLGFQTIGTYFAAEYAARGAGQSLRRFMVHAYTHILFPGLLILAVAGWLAPNWGPAGVRAAELWIPLCILAVATAIIHVNGTVLVGLKKPYAGFFADTIFRPLIAFTAFFITLVLFSNSDVIAAMLWQIALALLAVSMVHLVLALRNVSSQPTTAPVPPGEWRRWWLFALPWVAISLTTDFFFDLDLLVLSSMLSKDEIAVFGVCTRIFVLAAFGVTAVYAVAVPGLLEDGINKDADGLAAKIGDANLAASGLALVLLGGVAVLGPLVLGLFGPDFSAGLVPLLILCATLLVRAVLGPASLILTANNYPYANLPAIAVVLLCLVGGNLVLVPAFGITGAASAAFLALLAGALMLWFTTLRMTGIDVSILPRIKRMFANAPA